MSTVRDADIRLLTLGDLDGAMQLSSTAGWNQRLADWQMLLALAPAGSFSATIDGRIVGTAIGIDYGAFGWIAMMLVDPGCRGRGLGARLLESAMEALPPGRAIRLDATPMGRPLYQRYGFRDESLLTRRVADTVQLREGETTPLAASVRPLSSSDLDDVARVDREAFGADRRTLLEWSRSRAQQYAWMVDDDAGPSYCFGRGGRLFEQIGPIVAHSDDSAVALLRAALCTAQGKAMAVDLFDDRGLQEHLQALGFTGQRPLFRMCRPGSRPHTQTRRPGPAEYAIFGPEFG